MHFFGLKDAMSFHPTLSKALETRKSAAQDFRDWATELAEQWGDTENLCAAHTTALLNQPNNEVSIQDRILKALKKLRKTLEAHEKKFA
jgi:hypothetical protein